MSTASTAPILVLARPDDPFADALRRIATSRSIHIWQPADLGEIGWSITLDHGETVVHLIDRIQDQRWESGALSGVWFQTLPPLAAIESLAESDRLYVIAEIRSSLVAVWRGVMCPIVGQSLSDEVEAALGPGPESRIALMRLGLPGAASIMGSSRIARLANEGVSIRVTSLHDGTSRWHEPGTADPHHDLDRSIAIASDDQRVRVIVMVGGGIRCLDLSATGEIVAVQPGSEDRVLAAAIRDATRLDVALAFCCMQNGSWRITRLSAQIPWWLADVAGMADWLGSWLLDRFAGCGRQTGEAIGHAA